MDIRDYFKYSDGKLFCCKKFTSRVRVGDEMGGGKGHTHSTFNKVSKQKSHWVFYFFNGRFPKGLLFVDGDSDNHKIENLVEVTSSKPLTKEWARFFFIYEDGKLYRRYSCRSFKAGLEVGTINSRGYRAVMVKKKWSLAHRIVWAYFNGEPTSECIDHINGNKLDNRIENLRQATFQQNNQNRKDAKGVTLVKKTGNWQAQICVSGKTVYLGSFVEKSDALNARKVAEDKYFGEFAK